MHSYYEILPKTYFDNVFAKVDNSLTRGECVCVSVMYGFGNKTVFGFLLHNLQLSSHYHNIIVFDPEINKGSLVRFIQKNHLSTQQKTVVIIRSLEKVGNRRQVLERLDSMRRANPTSLVFLGIADQTALVSPQDYCALSTVFFSEQIYIGPFSKAATIKMININSSYYGWKTPRKKYDLIYKISGGIPRLIKYICKELHQGNDITDFNTLLNNFALIFELDYLTKIMFNYDLLALNRLGITDSGVIKSHLLQYYLNRFSWKSIQNTHPQLSERELRLLSILTETKGTNPVSLNKIADALNLADEKYSLWGLYKSISRLKVKTKEKYLITNLRGRGYILRTRSRH